MKAVPPDASHWASPMGPESGPAPIAFTPRHVGLPVGRRSLTAQRPNPRACDRTDALEATDKS
eukprot:2470305-Alexandrium_andersonii.AAC.1